VTDARLVLTTLPTAEAAASLARTLVEERLAACGNVVPGLRSIYRWEGKLHDEGEALLLIKTRAGQLDRLQARILELHPYQVPEVVAVAVDTIAPAYLAWLLSETA
jgi:periplasmic divalent cation tolerance protein